MESRSSLLFLLPVLVGLSVTPSLAQTQKPDAAASFRCPVTVPNSNEPPSSEPPSKFPTWVAERNREGDTLLMATRPMRTSFHGNGKLWTILPPRVLRGGAFPEYGELAREVQIDWWEMGRGLLTIKGTRLDGPAEPLHVEGWGRWGPLRGADGTSHVMATVIFPTEGCWEITGKIYDIDDSALTFVVEVRVPK
jgi:hypothetical protein